MAGKADHSVMAFILIVCACSSLSLLASNVDQDEPLTRRREAIERLRAELGPLEPEPRSLRSASPAHAVWWLRGPGGRVRVEIRMTPELPPRVQTLSLTAVVLPPPGVRELADGIAAALGTDDPAVPAGWDPPDDGGEAHRSLRVAAVWAGRCRVADVVSGDGESDAAFRLEGAGPPLVLGLEWVPGTRRLTSLTLAPAT